MAKSSRICIVDYRVVQDSYKEVVDYYKRMLGNLPPVEIGKNLSVFKVFTVNDHDNKHTYKVELRVTGLDPDAPGLKHSPAVYWGSDSASTDYNQLDALSPAGYPKEPLRNDPAGNDPTGTPPQLGSVISPAFYRMGVTSNPNYPGDKGGQRGWLLALAGIGAFLAARALFVRQPLR